MALSRSTRGVVGGSFTRETRIAFGHGGDSPSYVAAQCLGGQALRRAMHKKENLKYVVSAWEESNNLVLGQWKVTDKSHEITAVPE